MEIGDEQVLNYDLIEDLLTLMQKIVAKEDAKKVLLTLRLIREQDDYYIPDEDREIFNEAIRAKLDLKYIDLLLQDYPIACESGGYPVHTACSVYREAIPIILKHAPDCASQCNKNGKSTLELFLKNDIQLDITSEELASTLNHLCGLDLNRTMSMNKELSFPIRRSIKE